MASPTIASSANTARMPDHPSHAPHAMYSLASPAPRAPIANSGTPSTKPAPQPTSASVIPKSPRPTSGPANARNSPTPRRLKVSQLGILRVFQSCHAAQPRRPNSGTRLNRNPGLAPCSGASQLSSVEAATIVSMLGLLPDAKKGRRPSGRRPLLVDCRAPGPATPLGVGDVISHAVELALHGSAEHLDGRDRGNDDQAGDQRVL